MREFFDEMCEKRFVCYGEEGLGFIECYGMESCCVACCQNDCFHCFVEGKGMFLYLVFFLI